MDNTYLIISQMYMCSVFFQQKSIKSTWVMGALFLLVHIATLILTYNA